MSDYHDGDVQASISRPRASASWRFRWRKGDRLSADGRWVRIEVSFHEDYAPRTAGTVPADRDYDLSRPTRFVIRDEGTSNSTSATIELDRDAFARLIQCGQAALRWD